MMLSKKKTYKLDSVLYNSSLFILFISTSDIHLVLFENVNISCYFGTQTILTICQYKTQIVIADVKSP